jgi:hypothetical protein
MLQFIHPTISELLLWLIVKQKKNEKIMIVRTRELAHKLLFQVNYIYKVGVSMILKRKKNFYFYICHIKMKICVFASSEIALHTLVERFGLAHSRRISLNRRLECKLFIKNQLCLISNIKDEYSFKRVLL